MSSPSLSPPTSSLVLGFGRNFGLLNYDTTCGLGSPRGFSPDILSYWGSYFKCWKSCAFSSLGSGAAVGCQCRSSSRRAALCAGASAGCPCCACAGELGCRTPLLCARGSLGAGATAGRQNSFIFHYSNSFKNLRLSRAQRFTQHPSSIIRLSPFWALNCVGRLSGPWGLTLSFPYPTLGLRQKHTVCGLHSICRFT